MCLLLRRWLAEVLAAVVDEARAGGRSGDGAQRVPGQYAFGASCDGTSGGAPARGGGRGRGPASPEQQEYQAKLKDWRLGTSPATWKGVRKQFNDAGIDVQILCYNMNMSMPDEEIDYAFHMAQGLGVRAISCSSTVSSQNAWFRMPRSTR